LASRRRKRIGIRGERHRVQVLASVERKLRDGLTGDHGAEGRVFGPQQIGAGRNLDGLGNLSDLEGEIETHGLLHFDFDVVADLGLETGMFGLDIVDAGRHCGEGIEALTVAVGEAESVGAGVGQGDHGAGHPIAAPIANPASDFPYRLPQQR
jgi:hypothetical protein